MTLTPLGRFFLPRARELLADGQRLEEDTRDVASGKSGWLGIGFVRSLLNSVLPAAVRAFRLKHPDVKLDLVELLSEHQPAHLRSGRIHIGLSRFAERPISPPADLRHVPSEARCRWPNCRSCRSSHVDQARSWLAASRLSRYPDWPSMY
jgi:LysR family transcriptional regulator, benzoate and cis,cis-muconate-responsive activator of ben and cat genes